MTLCNYNLITIAAEVGIHKHIWFKDDIVKSYDEYQQDLIIGLNKIKMNIDTLRKLEPSCGFGTIEDLISYIEIIIKE